MDIASEFSKRRFQVGNVLKIFINDKTSLFLALLLIAARPLQSEFGTHAEPTNQQVTRFSIVSCPTI